MVPANRPRKVRSSGKQKKKELQARRVENRERQLHDDDAEAAESAGGSANDLLVERGGVTYRVVFDSDDDDDAGAGGGESDTGASRGGGHGGGGGAPATPEEQLAATAEKAVKRALRALEERLSRLRPHAYDTEDAKWLRLASATGAAVRAHKGVAPVASFGVLQHALQVRPLPRTTGMAGLSLG